MQVKASVHMLIYRFAISPGNPGYQSQSSAGPMAVADHAVSHQGSEQELGCTPFLGGWRYVVRLWSSCFGREEIGLRVVSSSPRSHRRAVSHVQVKLMSMVFDHNPLWENQVIAKIHKDTRFSTLHTLVGKINILIRLAKQAHQARRGFGASQMKRISIGNSSDLKVHLPQHNRFWKGSLPWQFATDQPWLIKMKAAKQIQNHPMFNLLPPTLLATKWCSIPQWTCANVGYNFGNYTSLIINQSLL